MAKSKKDDTVQEAPKSKIRERVSSADEQPVSKMAQLLEKSSFAPRAFYKGQNVEGTIVAKFGDTVLVDIGAKAEGVISVKELNEAGESTEVGAKLTAMVAQPENDYGNVLLTLKKPPKEKSWESLQEIADKGEIITVKGLEANKGGLLVD
jgi:ribosomal protein S1